MAAGCEAHALEGIDCPAVASGGCYPRVEKAVGDVVDGCCVLSEEELLEDETDPGDTQDCQLPVGQGSHVEPGDAYCPTRWPIQATGDVQQGRLARARRPHDRHQLAGSHAEAHVSQRTNGRVARVDLGHVVELEDEWRGAGTGVGRRRLCCGLTGVRWGVPAAHMFGTTIRCPAASPEPATWTP